MPVLKKEDKNLLKNYRLISLLPIFGKIFERILFKDLFNCFHKNQLFTKCQSGFLPGDSWISQLLSTIHDINSSFDCDPTIDVSGVFLDISKAFDKVWHDGIIFKLETYAHVRFQMVVLNGQISTWELAKSGVSQRFVLGPLMFLIYINDLPDNIQSTCRIFADRTSLFSHVFNKDTSQDELNHDLQKVSDWVFQWKMQFNRDPIMIQLIQMQFSCDPNKQAKEVISSKKAECNNSFPLPFNKTEVETCQSQKHLGLILDKRLNFTEHINSKISKCDKLIGIIKKLSISFPRNALLRVCKSFIRPHLDYAGIIYDKSNNVSFKNKIENVQYRACIAITGTIQGTSRERLYRELGLESLTDRRWIRKLVLFYKIVAGLSPQYLSRYLNLNNNSSYITRSSNLNRIRGIRSRTEQFKYSFFPFCINEWNKLGNMIKKSVNIKCFKFM